MLRPIIAFTLLVTGLVGCATSAPSQTPRTTASVQAVYVEVASDIYVSERLLAATPTRDYWVKVALGDSSAMALVPAALEVAAGDTVGVALAPLAARDGETPLRPRNRVTDIVSRGVLAQAPTRAAPDLIDHYLEGVASVAR